MLFLRGAWRSLSCAIGFVLFLVGIAQAQEQSTLVGKPPKPRIVSENAETLSISKSSLIHSYFDPVQGASANEIVRRALAANGELAAARMEIGRARARLRQAGLRPNPTIDVEQSTGRLTGSPGESEVSVGLAVPIEFSGKAPTKKLTCPNQIGNHREAQIFGTAKKRTGLNESPGPIVLPQNF